MQVCFPNFILDNMRQADEIHFNLDGFDSQSYQKYLADRQNFINQSNITDPTKLNWFDKDNRQITNWEYYTIISNSDLLAKTTFYGSGGTKIPPAQ